MTSRRPGLAIGMEYPEGGRRDRGPNAHWGSGCLGALRCRWIAHCGSAPLRSAGRIGVERAHAEVRPTPDGIWRPAGNSWTVHRAGSTRRSRQDTFDDFYQQAWFNQNWLKPRQFWIYDRMGASAVTDIAWAIAGSVLVLVLLAVYWRTESWLAGLLAAALVGIGARDFLEPRAAIVGLLCLAALWALICAIEGQRHRRRLADRPLLLLGVLEQRPRRGSSLAMETSILCGAPVGRSAVPGERAGIVLLVVPLVVASYLLPVRVTLLLSNYPGALRWLPLPVFVGVLGRCSVRQVGHRSKRRADSLHRCRAGYGDHHHPVSVRSGSRLSHIPAKIAASTIFRTVSERHPAYSHIGDLGTPRCGASG